MAKCDNPQKIFDYLINPAMAIEDYYKTFIDQ
jgi:hypothetical protein